MCLLDGWRCAFTMFKVSVQNSSWFNQSQSKTVARAATSVLKPANPAFQDWCCSEFIWFLCFCFVLFYSKTTLIWGENTSSLTAGLSALARIPPSPRHKQSFQRKSAVYQTDSSFSRRQGWWHYGAHQARRDGKYGAHHMAGAAGPQWDDHPVRGQLQEARRHGGEEAQRLPDTSVALSFH